METINLSKTWKPKRALAITALAAVIFAYATPGHAAAAQIDAPSITVLMDDHSEPESTDVPPIVDEVNPNDSPGPLAPPPGTSSQHARPHILVFDGFCNSSIYDVAAKYSFCTLKVQAKRGGEPNFAACEEKVVRWARKSEKACCSVHSGDPAAHEASVETVDEAIVGASGVDYCVDDSCVAPGEGSCDGGADAPPPRSWPRPTP